MKTIALALSVGPLLAFTACSSLRTTALDRATFDLDCPKDKIEVVSIGGTSYGAKGCGKKATYTCAAEGSFATKCVKDSESHGK